MSEINDDAKAAADVTAEVAMAASVDGDLVKRIVEAALFAAGQPLSLNQLRDLFPDDQALPSAAIERALDTLAQENASRGVELIEVASGFRFQVRAEVHPWVSKLWAERQTRYTRSLLETLALIAYRQPITRGEIEQIRGVAVNTNTIRTLEEREWVRVVGHRDVPGKPALYGTTRGFLDYFNLRGLDQLPPLGELHDLPELEPELSFDGPQMRPPGIEIPAVSIPLIDAVDEALRTTPAIDAVDEASPASHVTDAVDDSTQRVDPSTPEHSA